MRDTRFDSRSSEWIGDMTVWLRETAEDNHDQLERLRRNLRRAREQELTPRQQARILGIATQDRNRRRHRLRHVRMQFGRTG